MLLEYFAFRTYDMSKGLFYFRFIVIDSLNIQTFRKVFMKRKEAVRIDIGFKLSLINAGIENLTILMLIFNHKHSNYFLCHQKQA
jgi:hypothetical protein